MGEYLTEISGNPEILKTLWWIFSFLVPGKQSSRFLNTTIGSHKTAIEE